MNLKRNNWTNDEVMKILAGLKIVDKNGDHIDGEWNAAIDVCALQFYDFSRPETDHAAMAYDPESKRIFVVGPHLPQH